jgi:hypothetical protein
LKTSNAFESNQNAKVERAIRLVMDRARALMMDVKLPARYWPFALKAAAHVINVLPNDDQISAYEKWEKLKPPYKRLRIFGCLVYVRVPKHKLSKLDTRVIEGAMLGYTKNGYIIGIS